MKNFPNIQTIVRWILTLVFLGFVFMNSHWSVFGVLVLVTIGVEGATALIKVLARSVLAVKQAQEASDRETTLKITNLRREFVGIVKEAADEMSVYIPKKPDTFMTAPPPKPSPDKPRCGKCLAEATNGAIVYYQNNCPIHD